MTYGWYEGDFEMFGIEPLGHDVRYGYMSEWIEVVRKFWTTEGEFDHDGKYFHVKRGFSEPKPIQKPYPPFVIGGGGEELTLRIVARYADIWNFAGGDIDTFRHKNDVLDRHCAAVGRDPADVVRSVQMRVNYDDVEATRDEAGAFIEAGAGHVILMLSPPYPERIVHRLVDAVVEPLRE
jgi:alkanesulfonate monooxygenase SsuD/methylene tetrahydromethanopterin reductase-like flavin-dependent oxidoreductase (luciferase family)